MPLIALVMFLGLRAWDSQRGLPLEPGTPTSPTSSPPRNSTASTGPTTSPPSSRIFDEVRTEVTQKLTPEERVPVNRYFEGSPVYPGRFADDWNRSHVLEPDGPPWVPSSCCMG